MTPGKCNQEVHAIADTVVPSSPPRPAPPRFARPRSLPSLPQRAASEHSFRYCHLSCAKRAGQPPELGAAEGGEVPVRPGAGGKPGEPCGLHFSLVGSAAVARSQCQKMLSIFLPILLPRPCCRSASTGGGGGSACMVRRQLAGAREERGVLGHTAEAAAGGQLTSATLACGLPRRREVRLPAPAGAGGTAGGAGGAAVRQGRGGPGLHLFHLLLVPTAGAAPVHPPKLARPEAAAL